ncbi:unnamed protein product [Closterium sp. NIES-65]|nr:unnamed protein product [Closterium sp. NIES-65]
MTIPAFPKAAATHQHGGAASCSAAATSSTPISGTGLLDLPLDTICTILHRLKPKDLIAASLTCRTLHGLIDQPNTWLTLCRKWEGQLALSEWLVHANSAKCLFRLLHTLSPLVGVWAAEDLAPRGGLLYVTWERMAVVAYRIIPDWLDGNLISARLFTISAFPDGTTQLSLVTGRGADDEFPLELPGVLVWESPARAKFHLQTLLPPSSRSPASFAASPFAKVAGNRHGVEILNVAVESGEIVATKIVGDPNVPGGHVSFKARIDSVQTAADDSDRWNQVVGQARSLIRAQGQAADPALGQQLQFSNLLEGEGRIADYNFKNPQWVNGTLLVDSAGRISFLWEELNFLVQMKRLHVEELLFNA